MLAPSRVHAGELQLAIKGYKYVEHAVQVQHVVQKDGCQRPTARVRKYILK